jgi:hypothetical protein
LLKNYQQHEDLSNEQTNSKQFEYFKNIECQKAFYFMSKENTIRRLFYRLVKTEIFDNMILLIIMISTLKLIIDTYMESEDSISNGFDIFFTTIFTMEALMKAISFGFIMNNHSYLRDYWSQLDFIIVCLSLIDISFQGLDLGALKTLRLLRILRPLRFISHNQNMRLVVTALLESVSGIANVFLVILLIW